MPDADLGSPTEPASLQSSSVAVDILAAASATEGSQEMSVTRQTQCRVFW